MKCCGQPCFTPFCPHCGKRDASPLPSLVAYLRTLQSHQEKRLAAKKEKNPTGRSVAHTERLMNKWKSWADAVEKLAVDAAERPE